MIFLTVGTQFPFDRLVRAVDELVGSGALQEEVFGQIGNTAYKPRHFEAVASLDKHLFDLYFRRASAVVSHAGMGTIAMALRQGKPLLVMPRLKRHQEVVNNHQLKLAERFASLGHILLALREEELPEKTALLRSFTPKAREADPAGVVERIAVFLNQLSVES